jgi:hypothetical protein
MNRFSAFLCLAAIGGVVSQAAVCADVRQCTAPAATQTGGPASGKTRPSSFAPHADSRRRAYGAPIQAPITHRRSASHRGHPRSHAHQPSAPAVR